MHAQNQSETTRPDPDRMLGPPPSTHFDTLGELGWVNYSEDPWKPDRRHSCRSSAVFFCFFFISMTNARAEACPR